MRIKDIHGNSITIKQAKSGAIIIPFASFFLLLTKDQTLNFTLYDIEDFDIDLFNKYYS